MKECPTVLSRRVRPGQSTIAQLPGVLLATVTSKSGLLEVLSGSVPKHQIYSHEN